MTKIWLISDTHFSHHNIINLCNRPFKSIKHMNAVIIRNWNRIIGKRDYVIFLGDLGFGGFIRFLNGQKIMIKGNHDPGGIDKLVINSEGVNVLLTHNPEDVPFDGWVIHGHRHNTIPLIDFDQRRVNVSIENTGYKPIELSKVVAMIKGGIT